MIPAGTNSMPGGQGSFGFCHRFISANVARESRQNVAPRQANVTRRLAALLMTDEDINLAVSNCLCGINLRICSS